MASWMVHLRIADKLLDMIGDLEETEFIVGNIAPDSGVPTEDWSAFVPSSAISHFKIPKENQNGLSSEINTEEYLRQYFTKEMRAGYNKKQYSFYLGYYVHLLTDVLWKAEIFAESVAADKKAYETDPNGTVWKWKADWYDLDFLYLHEHSDFRAFRIYEQAEGFSNEYMDIFAVDAFDNRRKYITTFYHEKRDNLDREYPWLTKKRMDSFVEYAVRYIEENIKKL